MKHFSATACACLFGLVSMVYSYTTDAAILPATGDLSSTLAVYQYQQNSNNTESITRMVVTYGMTDLLKKNSPARTTTITQDNLTGNALAHKIADEPAHEVSYDALGRELINSVAGQAQQTHAYTWENGKQQLQTTNQLTSYQETTAFNSLGQQISRCDNVDAQCTKNSYNDLGQLAAYTDSDGVLTQTSFDVTGRKLRQIKTSNAITLQNQYYSYDDVKHTVSHYEKALDGSTQTVRVTKQLNDNQQVTQQQLTEGANVLSSDKTVWNNFAEKNNTAMSGSKSTADYMGAYQYNALGEVQQASVDGGKNKINALFDHDLMGHLISKTLQPINVDKPIHRYQLTFNGQGQLVKKTLFGNQQTTISQSYRYDDRGNRISASNFNGQLLYRYQYKNILGDDKLMCTDVVASDHSVAYSVRREYDDGTHTGDVKTGKLRRIYDSKQACGMANASAVYNEIGYTYWPISGYLKEKIYPGKQGDNIIHYDYQGSKLSQVTDIAGNTTHYYRQAGRLSAAIMSIKAANGAVTTLETDYNYGTFRQGKLGYLSNVQRWQTTAQLGRRMIDSTAYTHDSRANVTQILQYDPSHSGDAQFHNLIKLTYDANNNMLSKTVSNANFQSYTEAYTYDGKNRLTSVKHDDALGSIDNEHDTTVYQHDNNSNLHSQVTTKNPTVMGHLSAAPTDRTFEHNGFDQIIRVNNSAVSYNNNDPAEHNGNLTMDDLGNQYGYDRENRLIREQSSKVTAHFNYYADGSRKSWQYQARDKHANAHRLCFFTTGKQDINEVDESGNQASYFLAGGQRQARITQIAGNIKVSFYGQDNKHSVINTQTDNGEKKQVNYVRYDAYGNVLARQAVTAATQTISYDGFGYDGEYRDPKQAGGLIYLRARYYNPRLASFMQRDSYVFMNEYAFVGGNPNSYGDPSGHVRTPLSQLEELAEDVVEGADTELLLGVEVATDLMSPGGSNSLEIATWPGRATPRSMSGNSMPIDWLDSHEEANASKTVSSIEKSSSPSLEMWVFNESTPVSSLNLPPADDAARSQITREWERDYCDFMNGHRDFMRAGLAQGRLPSDALFDQAHGIFVDAQLTLEESGVETMNQQWDRQTAEREAWEEAVYRSQPRRAPVIVARPDENTKRIEGCGEVDKTKVLKALE